MGLIVFEILFVLVFIVLSFFLITRKDRYGKVLSLMSFIASFATILLAVLYSLLYFEFAGVYKTVFTKIIFVCIAGITGILLYITLKAPYFSKKKIPLIITVIFAVANIIIGALCVKEIAWDGLRGFYIEQTAFPALKDFSIMKMFFIVNFSIAPFLFSMILFVRIGFIKSNIYTQQLRLTAITILLFTVLQTALSWFAANMFSWLISFIPLGYLVLTILLSYTFSLTVVLDRREIGQSILRFFIFTLIFAVIDGLLVGYFLTYIRNLNLQITLIVISTALILFLRELITARFGGFFKSTTEYERKLEDALQNIDYTKGRDEVIFSLTENLKRLVGCSTVDILIADDNYDLNIDFSTTGTTGNFKTDTPAFDFLLEKNVDVLLHTEVISSYEYAEHKAELNAVFWKTNADLILFIRDGQKIIAGFALGQRLKKAEYGYYDTVVFRKFYSYFFLVAYYLRNIAKEDIMITVDREIEMSDQIIGAIQASVSKIENEIISVDSVAYSAYKLGGDFIDFIKLADNKYFFLIGDVAGKGLSASMSMVILKSVLRTYLEASGDFKGLVVKLNTFIKENLPRGTFFAGLFGILDLKTQTIYYLNCGIPLMSMYIKSYNNAIEIQGEGRVLGFAKNIEPFLKLRKITMHPNDIIVFTTDGLLDSENLRGDRFGKDRVASIVTQNNAMSSKEIAEKIYARVEDFVPRELQDDVTILVFKHIGKTV